MSSKSSKKISRRDALKILMAAGGATALANVPGKWVAPGLSVGALPAHAQTSGGHTLTIDQNKLFDAGESRVDVTSNISIVPGAAGIPMLYSVSYTDSSNADKSAYLKDPPTGEINTDGSGRATYVVSFYNSFEDDLVKVTWSFKNASDGSGSGTQTFTGQSPK